jgi:hypothetical protein
VANTLAAHTGGLLRRAPAPAREDERNTKNFETRLRESQNRLRNAEEAGGVGTFELDLSSGHFSTKNGSLESLGPLLRRSCSPKSAKWRPTVLLEPPVWAATPRLTHQWGGDGACAAPWRSKPATCWSLSLRSRAGSKFRASSDDVALMR